MAGAGLAGGAGPARAGAGIKAGAEVGTGLALNLLGSCVLGLLGLPYMRLLGLLPGAETERELEDELMREQELRQGRELVQQLQLHLLQLGLQSRAS